MMSPGGAAHVPQLFPGLSAHSFQYQRAAQIDQQIHAAEIVVIHGGNWPQPWFFGPSQWRHGRPRSFIGSGTGEFVGGKGRFVGKGEFVAMDERARNEIRLAGRLWSIQRKQIQVGRGYAIYCEPGAASSEDDV